MHSKVSINIYNPRDSEFACSTKCAKQLGFLKNLQHLLGRFASSKNPCISRHRVGLAPLTKLIELRKPVNEIQHSQMAHAKLCQESTYPS